MFDLGFYTAAVQRELVRLNAPRSLVERVAFLHAGRIFDAYHANTRPELLAGELLKLPR